MATRTISTRLAIEGEAEFRQQIKNCNNEISTMKSQLAAVTSEYRNNANSLEALTAKSKAYSDLQQAQTKKVEQLKAALENAQKAQQEQAKTIEETGKQLESSNAAIEKLDESTKKAGEQWLKYSEDVKSAEKQLDTLKKSNSDTSGEQEKLNDQIADAKNKMAELEQSTEGAAKTAGELLKENKNLTATYEESQAKQDAATRSVNNWTMQLNNAQIQLNKTNDQIDQNNRYLQEAKNSVDRCATSIDQYGKETKEAAQQSQNFGGQTTTAINDLAGVLAAAGVAEGVREIARALIECVDSSKQFEQGMAEVFTLLPDMSEDARTQMSADMLQFSSDMNVLTDEAVPALYSAISASVPPDNVFDFLSTAQKAAVGGVSDLETSIDGLTSVVNAYGDDVLEASEASDLMFTAVKLGKTTFDELSSSLYNVVPTAVGAGVSFDQVTAALAAMTAQGTPTSVATTQLRQAIVELSKDGTATDKVFKELAGQSFKQFIASGNNLQQAFQLLESHAEATGKGVNDLFGSVEAGNAVLQLTGKGTDRFTAALEGMAESTGATDEAYSVMADTVEYSAQRVEVAMDNIKIAIGDTLAPAVKNLNNVVADVVGWATEIIDQNPWLVQAITVLTAGIGAFIISITAATAATIALKTAMTAVAAHPLILPVTAILGAVAALTALVATMSDSTESVKNLTKASTEAEETFEETKKTFEENSQEIEGTAIAAERYIEKLEELEKQGLKTDEAQKEYERTVEQLNTLIPELNIVIDEQTGLIEGGTAALKQNAEAWKNNAIAQALSKKMAEDAEAYGEAIIELRKNTEAYKKSQKSANEAQKEMDDILLQMQEEGVLQQLADNMGVTTEQAQTLAETVSETAFANITTNEELIESYIAAREELESNTASMKTHKEAMDINNETIAELDGKLNETSKLYDNLTEDTEGLTGATGEHAIAVKAYCDSVQAEMNELMTAYQASYDAAYENISKEIGLFNELSVKGDQSIDDLIAALNSQISFMDTYAGDIQKAMEKGVDAGLVAKLSDGSEESAQILHTIVNSGDEKIKELNEKFLGVEQGKKDFSAQIADMETDFSNKWDDMERRLDRGIKELDRAGEAAQAGANVVKGWIEGFDLWEDQALKKVNSFGNKVTDKLRESLDEHSPSKKSEKAAEDYGEGFVIGMQNKQREMEQVMQETANLVHNTMLTSIPQTTDIPTSGTDLTPVINAIYAIGAKLGMTSDNATNVNIYGDYSDIDYDDELLANRIDRMLGRLYRRST